MDVSLKPWKAYRCDIS